MLTGQTQGAETNILLNPVSAANTAAATSSWIDVRKYEGDLVFICQAGAVTGSITYAIQDADDGSGTNSAAVTPNEGAFTVISSANAVQKRTVNANTVRGWVRVVGTIVTGPVLVAASVTGLPKYV